MRPHDYFEDDVLDFDLLEQLRARPVAEYTDVEAALALAELLSQEFLLYGTNGEQHITDQGSRAAMRTLTALTKRLNVEWKPDFLDFPSFRAYWGAYNGYRNWQARRECAGSAGDDEASSAERDQLFEPPGGKGRTNAREGDPEALSAVVDLEDGMASHFRPESPDLRTAEFGYQTRDRVLEEAEHERLWDIERRDRPRRVDDHISRRIELHQRELAAGHPEGGLGSGWWCPIIRVPPRLRKEMVRQLLRRTASWLPTPSFSADADRG